jgi:hypothetical protein
MAGPTPDPPSGTAPRFVLAFTAATIPEAVAVRGLLESEGITVEVKGEMDGPYRFGPVYLFVPDAFEVQARLLVEGLNAADDLEKSPPDQVAGPQPDQVEDQA